MTPGRWQQPLTGPWKHPLTTVASNCSQGEHMQLQNNERTATSPLDQMEQQLDDGRLGEDNEKEAKRMTNRPKRYQTTSFGPLVGFSSDFLTLLLTSFFREKGAPGTTTTRAPHSCQPLLVGWIADGRCRTGAQRQPQHMPLPLQATARRAESKG